MLWLMPRRDLDWSISARRLFQTTNKARKLCARCKRPISRNGGRLLGSSGSKQSEPLPGHADCRGTFDSAERHCGRRMNNPKSGSWRPAAVWQIADIMRYGQETRGFAAVTGG